MSGVIDIDRIFEYQKHGKQYIVQKFKGIYHRFNWHNTIELMVVLSGEVEVFSDGVSYLHQEDDVLVLGTNCGHALRPKSKDCIIFTTELSADFLYAEGMPVFRYGSLSSHEGSDHVVLWKTVRQRLVAINDYMRDLEPDDAWGGKALEATAISIIADIYRAYRDNIGKELLESKENKKNEMIALTEAYINQHFQEKISLDMIAKEVGYNKSYLTSLFKKQIGIGIYEYIIRRRMQHGMRLLRQSDQNVIDIAYECGFADNHSFAVYFKKYCGCTPQEYQRMYARAEETGTSTGSQSKIESKTDEYRRMENDTALQNVMSQLKDIIEQYGK